MKKQLTQKELKRVLHYNPETGVFTWKIATACVKVGKVAGYINDNGYVIISVHGRDYRAHRLAWLYKKGYFPEHDVDHLNRIRHDNRWSEIRHVTRQCNLRNSEKRKDNTSGVAGVCWSKNRQKWVAAIGINNKTHKLGSYSDFSEAVLARLATEICLNWGGCNSASSAYKYCIDNRLIKGLK